MRKIFNPAFLRASQNGLKQYPKLRDYRPFLLGPSKLVPSRSLAQVRSNQELLSELWFTPSGSYAPQLDDPARKHQDAPPDQRTLKLGESEHCETLILILAHGP